MTEDKAQQITNTTEDVARKVLKHLLKSGHGHDGELSIRLDNNFRWWVARIAQETDLPFVDVLNFMAKLAGEILVEVVDKDKPPTERELNPGHGGH